MKYKKLFKNLYERICISFFAILLLSVLFMSACSGNTKTPHGAKENVSVTVFNGEHYKVKGENKKTVRRGENVLYEVALDEGYELVSSFGAECTIPSFKENYSFTQNVEFSSVNYDTAVTFETRKLELTEFSAESNIQSCQVEIQSASGYFSEGELYADDVINLYAVPSTGYRFHCWSTGNYLSAGGTYFSKESILNEFDFNSTHALFANFKSTADSARTIIYDLGDGVEIEQDCSPILAHHYRANTLTEPDLLENGYDLPQDKMLIGWNTAEGEYVGLGSRTAVSDETFITLYPVWKDYSDENDFEFDNGKITAYNGDSKEVTVPRKIDGQEVTGISANAFEECAAETCYLPSTVTSVEENAFLNCAALKEFYMSDNVMNISDESFTGCTNFTTLHLNAYLKPRYITDITSPKTDVYDNMILNRNEPKCLVLGGSSVRYGYNSNLSEELLNQQCRVYIIGQNYWMCGYAFYDIVDGYLNKGDIFLHAPEHDCSVWCGKLDTSALTNEITISVDQPYLYYICESNWQLLAELNINKYANFFNQFATVNNLRNTMQGCEYYDYCTKYGYTITGEAVFDECGDDNRNFRSPIYLSFNTSIELITLADTNIYKPLIEKGINVCLTFAPINRNNLYDTYQSEAELKTAADRFTQIVRSTVSDGVNILLSQYDTVYNGGSFSDSDYHLGAPTRDVHTTKVMNALVQALGL